MPRMPRESVVNILKTLLASTEANARRSSASREWLDGRASGIQSALDILTLNEDDLLPPADQRAHRANT